MNIRELSQPVTSKRLNENMARQLGYRLNLEKFTHAQLEDARNKMRTEMSQFEVSESFDSVNTSPQYQKVRMLHDVINAEILEREAKAEDEDNQLDSDSDTPKAKKKTEESMDQNIYIAKLAKKAQEHQVPNAWIANAIRNISLNESVDQEELSSELQLRYDLSESVANHIVYLAEGEEDEAKIIMSTKDMVDRITGWLDDVSKMKAEQLLQLLDSIGETKGSDVAAQYGQAVKPALEEIYASLEATRNSLKQAMSIVAGDGSGAEIMGTEPGAMSGTVPGEEELGLGGDEMGGMPGEEPMGAEPAGREMRENAAYSRKLGMLLAASKKKVTEEIDPLLLSLQSIQASANRTKTVAPLRWSALSSELSSDDAPGVGYREFAARWNDPNDKVMQHIKQAKIVKKFDSNGIVINTKQAGAEEQEVQGEPDNKNVLDQTAMSAAKRMN